LPRSLAEVKVSPEHYAVIAEGAMKTPWVPKNPRPIRGPADIVEILKLTA
jgi:maleylacetate reductase